MKELCLSIPLSAFHLILITIETHSFAYFLAVDVQLVAVEVDIAVG